MSSCAVSGCSSDVSYMQARFQQAQAARFEAADTDGTGGLSVEEFASARPEGPGGPGGPGGPEDSANAAEAPSIEDSFAEIDSDGDGELSLEEFSEARPPAPPPPNGSFAPETLSSLLSVQEEDSGSSSIVDLLTSASETDESDLSSIIDSILEEIGAAEDGEAQEAA